MPFPSTYVFICFTHIMMYNLWKKVGYSAILAANLRAVKLRLPVPLAATFQFQSLLGHLLTLELLLKGLSSTVRGCHGRKTAWRHVFSGSEPHWHHWSVQTISNMYVWISLQGKWWYDMTRIPFECFPLLGLAVLHVQAARYSKSQQASKNTQISRCPCSIFLPFHHIINYPCWVQHLLQLRKAGLAQRRSNPLSTNSLAHSGSLFLESHPLIIAHSYGNLWKIHHSLIDFNRLIILKLIIFYYITKGYLSISVLCWFPIWAWHWENGHISSHSPVEKPSKTHGRKPIPACSLEALNVLAGAWAIPCHMSLGIILSFLWLKITVK